ncbi:DUF1189 domain-containing protein [Listeria sp. PSOL-1]|uniref:DUF1189 domain-containing protein n=1 Tax=Listeria sp. PSOL-1 TaxID=1844999 RepID=UPI0013D61AD6|nr:DUF1189 domain-containing protein [Listeria sp. PSOL-1]
MNLFKRFWKSLYSPADIATFRQDKTSKSIIYLVILSFVAFLPLAFYTTMTVRDALKIGQETIKNEIPEFSTTNGKLVTKNKTLPIAIDKGKLHIYFDSTGTLDSDDIDNKVSSYDGAIAFLADKIYFTGPGISQSIGYDAAGIHNKADLLNNYQAIDKLSKYLSPIILVFVFIFMLGVTFLRVAIYALFGFILSGFGKAGISYRENWMIAAYSITLATTFEMIMSWLQTAVPFGTEINIIVSLIIIFLTLRTIPAKLAE